MVTSETSTDISTEGVNAFSGSHETAVFFVILLAFNHDHICLRLQKLNYLKKVPPPLILYVTEVVTCVNWTTE